MSVTRAQSTRSVWEELVTDLPIGVIVTDATGAVLANNDLAAELLGCTTEQLRAGLRPDGWRARDEGGSALPSPAEIAEQVLRTRASLALPVLVAPADAPPVRLWVSHHPIGQNLLIALRPVHTDLGTAYGLRDALTGLPNRALFTDRLEQALVRARTHGTLVSVVLLDIAGMARINAEHGFRRGDDLLSLVAGRLRGGLRADHTVARYAGDRFAVVAEHSTGTGQAVATRATELITRSAKLGPVRLRPAARVCWLTADGNTPGHRLLTRLEARLAGGAAEFPHPRPADQE
jgi:diguanylate cyclase (GGDEF)-like protein